MKLNVILVTYNHSKYIEESLQSIIRQKTDFDFNIIIADDKSTDDTLTKIKNCEKTCTIPFQYLESEKNLGITKNYQRAFNSCDAEYIAIMEGDDIWTDPYRLQKHIDFLDSHFECVMTFNRYIVSDFEKVRFHIQPSWEPPNGYQLVTSRDLARDNVIGNFSTCVYRKKAIKNLPEELFEITAYDWITNILVGKNGMIGYLSDLMNIYRIHSDGMWSGQTEEDNIKKTLSCIDIYDKLTEGLFEDEFNNYKNRLQKQLLRAMVNKRIDHSRAAHIRKVLKLVKNIMPPFIIWILKAIIPVKVWKKLMGDI